MGVGGKNQQLDFFFYPGINKNVFIKRLYKSKFSSSLNWVIWLLLKHQPVNLWEKKAVHF